MGFFVEQVEIRHDLFDDSQIMSNPPNLHPNNLKDLSNTIQKVKFTKKNTFPSFVIQKFILNSLDPWGMITAFLPGSNFFFVSGAATSKGIDGTSGAAGLDTMAEDLDQLKHLGIPYFFLDLFSIGMGLEGLVGG